MNAFPRPSLCGDLILIRADQIVLAIGSFEGNSVQNSETVILGERESLCVKKMNKNVLIVKDT